MSYKKIVAELSARLATVAAKPSETVYTISIQELLSAIAKRMGEDALALSTKDLLLARDEVRAAIDHHLDIREYMDIGLDSWEIVRKL